MFIWSLSIPFISFLLVVYCFAWHYITPSSGFTVFSTDDDRTLTIILPQNCSQMEKYFDLFEITRLYMASNVLIQHSTFDTFSKRFNNRTILRLFCT